MTDLSGITVCPGVMPGETREELEVVLSRIGAKPLQDLVRIDTTHFVCTEGRGHGWERAQEMNIPVVRPEWLFACEKDGRIVGVRQFYLNADIAKMRQGLPMRERAQTAASQTTVPGHRSTQSVHEGRTEAVERRVVSPMGRESQRVEEKPPTPEAREEKVEESPEVEKLGNGMSTGSTSPAPVESAPVAESTTPEAGAKIEEGFDDVQL